MADPTLARPAAAAPESQSLALAVAWLARHHGVARSPAALLAGLPIDGRLDAPLAARALAEAGLDAALLERRVAELHPLLLPAVLPTRDGGALVLLARHDDEAAGADGARFDVIVPGDDAVTCRLGAAALESQAAGPLIVAAPRVAAATGTDALHDPGTHWLWGTLRRFVPHYRAALVAALLSNVLMLVTGLVTAVVFDKVIPHQAFVTLWTLAAAAGLAIVFDLVARQLRAYLIDMAGRKVDLLLGSMLFRQTLAVRMEHRPASAGAYAHTLAQIEVVREFFASATLAAVSDLPFIVVFVAMAFVIGGPLGWVLVAAIPLIVGAALLIQGALRRAMAANMKQQADLQGVLVEAVEGLEDLKAAGAQGRFVRRYEQTTAAAAETALQSRTMTSWAMNLSSVSQQLVTVVLLVWGVYLIDARMVTAGALIGTVMFGGRAIAPLTSLVMLAMRWQGARAAMRALDRVMRQPVDREPGRSYVPRPAVCGRLVLHEVGFAYPPAAAADGAPAAPAHAVLRGVTLRLEPGERVAVLGRIGSGKSTILRLAAGLYQPTEGRVEVDGIDLRQIDPAEWRAAVGFVAQDPRLFDGTLRDNVLLDRPSADPSRLAEAARLTGLDRVVAAHPLGWDLPVGEAGALLSGGQRQLVALARCLVTEPALLLMDEPTSSMDAQSEAAFLRQLDRASAGRTLVLVTHRPAALELVQRVVVVDAGRIVLDGPKAQVLAVLSAGPRPAGGVGGAAPVPAAVTA
ncbi:MAG: type I secretion system permease/ATPase [Rubrivivax sp.]|jgi:ATP-binding cassette subfamily C protein LapB|nr:type I secretion system permease/ATPase [Rubrivivax sp.]